jgi:hypothetical protein
MSQAEKHQWMRAVFMHERRRGVCARWGETMGKRRHEIDLTGDRIPVMSMLHLEVFREYVDHFEVRA